MESMIILGVMAAVGVGMVVYALMPRKQDEQGAVIRRMSGKTSTDEIKNASEHAKESVAARMMEKVAPLAIRPAMPKSLNEMSKLRIKLASAGYRNEKAPMLYLSSKSVIAILCAVAAIAFSVSRGNTAQQAIGMGLFGAALGFMAPNLWLGSCARKRAERIRNGLPDSLDLMVISVEAGLALDGALQRVGDEMRHVHPELSEEMQIATLETQMGIPRREALENMAERTQLPEVKSLVAIVNQAEKFGTSVARALRHQADALRVKRRQAAEERAQKTAVKLMAPLILFIFPAIFVVLAGPAALKMMDLAKTNTQLF